MDKCSIPELNFGTNYKIDCIRDGDVAWTESIDNLVVNTGLEYAMGCVFGTTQRKDLLLGICSDSSVSTTDTAEVHQFVEFLGTTSNSRPKTEFSDGGLVGDKYTYVTPSTQVMISTAGTITGVFMTDWATKGEDKGMLYGVASFISPKQVVPSDALLITVTVSAKG
jgi:hypothetical protein